MAKDFQTGAAHAAPPGSSLTQENNAWEILRLLLK